MSASGALLWSYGTISGNVRCNGGSISGSGGYPMYLTGGTLINVGVLTLGGGTPMYTGSGSVISNLGTFNVVMDVGTVASGSGPRTIYNAGLFSKTGGTGTSSFVETFNNTGTVETDSGTLDLAQGCEQTAGLTRLLGGVLRADLPFNLDGGMLAGTNALSGNLTNSGGVVMPGTDATSPGVLTLNGQYSQTFGDMSFGASGTNSGSRVSVSGTASLGGTLTMSLLSGYTAALGDTISLVTCAAETGRFSNFSLSGLDTNQAWEVVYTTNAVLLQVVSNANPVARISGWVKDNLSRPVTNVSVFAFTTNASLSLYLSARTDASGNYSLSVTNGVWQVGVQGLRAAGFNNVSNQTVGVSGADAAANFVVEPFVSQQLHRHCGGESAGGWQCLRHGQLHRGQRCELDGAGHQPAALCLRELDRERHL